jgi:lipopolysaccharide/colanic/teichoic acid biosynthesis glycosyltransferase
LFPEHAAGKWFYFLVVLFVSIQELFFFGLFQSYLVARKKELWESDEPFVAAVDAGFPVSGAPEPGTEIHTQGVYKALTPEVRDLIIHEIGEVPYKAIRNHLEKHLSPLLVVSTNTRFNIDIQPLLAYGTIVNLMKINSIRYLNKFFEVVNGKLDSGGIFIGHAEVYSTRKERILRYYPPMINYLVYTFDYLLNRVAPKLPFTRQIYFALTQGKERVLSRTETLGRLYSCGFEVTEDLEVNDLYYFVVRKTREPYYDNNPTYGALIRLNRVGKDGRIIGIYKLRTMHPYSEYLQPYIYEKNKLREGGKIHNDFRVTTLGSVARRFWIDELPMVINLIRGEVKLVGVRPLSRHFFNLYTPELKEKRIRTKPGLIPPYYADMPKTLDEVMASESRYLDEYFSHPVKTDIKYLLKALYQIIFRFARSG